MKDIHHYIRNLSTDDLTQIEIFIRAEKQRRNPASKDTIKSFLASLRIFHPAEGLISFRPYDFQTKLASTLVSSPKKLTVALTARQLGISTTMLAALLFVAKSTPYQTIVLASTGFNTVRNTLNRLRGLIESCTTDIPVMVSSTPTEITLSNGSRFIAKTVNAHFLAPVNQEDEITPTHILIEEAAYVSYSLDEVLWPRLLTQMANGTKVILTSSPRQPQGLFYTAWTTDMDAERLMLKWSDHPERDQEWANAMKAHLGPVKFAQEFDCQFTESV